MINSLVGFVEMIKSHITSLYELFTIYVLIILSSATVYAVAEGESFLDSLWWACVTAMTVGYGDMYPVTAIGKLDAIILMHIVPLFIIPMVVASVLAKVIEEN